MKISDSMQATRVQNRTLIFSLLLIFCSNFIHLCPWRPYPQLLKLKIKKSSFILDFHIRAHIQNKSEICLFFSMATLITTLIHASQLSRIFVRIIFLYKYKSDYATSLTWTFGLLSPLNKTKSLGVWQMGFASCLPF